MNCENLFEGLGETVGLFGLGKSNLDILSHLPKRTKVILRSEGKIPEIAKTECDIISVFEGKHAFDFPIEDTLILSPSVRRDRKELLPFRKRGVRFSSDAELFFEKVASPVFAVSGSDGKSTVTTLCSLLLREKFASAPAIGNIGVPMASSLLYGSDAYAAELSSFMLSYARVRAFRGAVTNINENHLNWHKDFAEYASAKLSLLKSARESVVPYDDRICRQYLENNTAYAVFSSEGSFHELKRSCTAQVYYTLEKGNILRNGDAFISEDILQKKNTTLQKNIMCALALSDGYATRQRAREVIDAFSGLEHRSELFYSFDGIDFIDSSVDTTPARTAETLTSLGRRVVIILGGQGKGLSYDPLTEPLKKYADAVILVGENSEEIARVIKDKSKLHFADSLKDAVEISKKFLKKGAALLLSPASASYDSFENFEERGKYFKKIIKEQFI